MNGTAEDVVGNRTFDDWNGCEDVVMAGSLVTFKGKLDHHLKNVRGLFKLWIFTFIAILDILDMLGGRMVNL